MLAGLLARLEEHGYHLTPAYEVMGGIVSGGGNTFPGYRGATQLDIEGPVEPTADLWAEMAADKTALLVFAVLREPPAWLARSLECYRAAHTVNTKCAGHEVGLRMGLETLAAHIAAAIGMSAACEDQIRPVVEEALMELGRERV